EAATMNRATIITICGSVLALLLGAIAGTSRAPLAGQSRPSPSDKLDASNRIKETERPRPTNDPLADALRTETGAKRWLLLVCAAEKATALDMPGLIRIAGNDSAA